MASPISGASTPQPHSSFFGLALREDFWSESDVDMLVEFEPDRILGLFGIAHMEGTSKNQASSAAG